MRQFRQLSDETKRKISTSMVNRPKSDVHKANISKSMKDYWAQVPSKPTAPTTDNNGLSGGGDGTQKTS